MRGSPRSDATTIELPALDHRLDGLDLRSFATDVRNRFVSRMDLEWAPIMEGIRPVALLTQAGFLTIQKRAGSQAIRIGCHNIQHNDYYVE